MPERHAASCVKEFHYGPCSCGAVRPKEALTSLEREGLGLIATVCDMSHGFSSRKALARNGVSNTTLKKLRGKHLVIRNMFGEESFLLTTAGKELLAEITARAQVM